MRMLRTTTRPLESDRDRERERERPNQKDRQCAERSQPRQEDPAFSDGKAKDPNATLLG